MNDVAAALGVSRQRVWTLRRLGRFPEPTATAGPLAYWSREVIEEFRRQRPGVVDPDES